MQAIDAMQHNEPMVSAANANSVGLGSVSPTRSEFRTLAEGRRVIPVVRRLLADGETPVGIYRKLAADRPGTFLFESAVNGQSWTRWSFIGVHSPATLTVRDGKAVWRGKPPTGLPVDGDPMTVLRETVAATVGPCLRPERWWHATAPGRRSPGR
jgi:anthranilate synthase component 1